LPGPGFKPPKNSALSLVPVPKYFAVISQLLIVITPQRHQFLGMLYFKVVITLFCINVQAGG